MYLGWFDDNPKKPITNRVLEAVAAYRQRFGEVPNLVLVNPEEVEAVEVGGVTVRGAAHIRKNNYWVGWEAK